MKQPEWRELTLCLFPTPPLGTGQPQHFLPTSDTGTAVPLTNYPVLNLLVSSLIIRVDDRQLA